MRRGRELLPPGHGGEGPQREVVLSAGLLNWRELAGGEKGRHNAVWAHEIIM